jgi:hypothetical protein
VIRRYAEAFFFGLKVFFLVGLISILKVEILPSISIDPSETKNMAPRYRLTTRINEETQRLQYFTGIVCVTFPLLSDPLLRLIATTRIQRSWKRELMCIGLTMEDVCPSMHPSVFLKVMDADEQWNFVYGIAAPSGVSMCVFNTTFA